MSLALPGANGMIAVMARVGQLWADTGPGQGSGQNQARSKRSTSQTSSILPENSCFLPSHRRVWHDGQGDVTWRRRPPGLPKAAAMLILSAAVSGRPWAAASLNLTGSAHDGASGLVQEASCATKFSIAMSILLLAGAARRYRAAGFALRRPADARPEQLQRRPPAGCPEQASAHGRRRTERAAACHPPGRSPRRRLPSPAGHATSRTARQSRNRLPGLRPRRRRAAPHRPSAGLATPRRAITTKHAPPGRPVPREETNLGRFGCSAGLAGMRKPDPDADLRHVGQAGACPATTTSGATIPVLFRPVAGACRPAPSSGSSPLALGNHGAN